MIVMVGVSYWGWKNIDPETRIRARDISEDSTMRTTTTALVWTPAIGLVILLGTLVVGDVTIAALGLPLLVIFLLAHWATVKRAVR